MSKSSEQSSETSEQSPSRVYRRKVTRSFITWEVYLDDGLAYTYGDDTKDITPLVDITESGSRDVWELPDALKSIYGGEIRDIDKSNRIARLRDRLAGSAILGISIMATIEHNPQVGITGMLIGAGVIGVRERVNRKKADSDEVGIKEKLKRVDRALELRENWSRSVAKTPLLE